MSDLPSGWTRFALKDLGGLSGGKTPSKANPAFWSSRDVPWVSPKDMKKNLLEDTEDRISRVAVEEVGMTLYPPGSVLMVTRSGILQHTFPVALSGVELAVNQDIKVFRPTQGIVPKFTFYMFKSSEREILSACSKDGTTVQSIDSEKLEAFLFSLPPTAEQNYIAQKLDELLAHVGTLKARIDSIPALLKLFRQSVLAAAVSGRLTEDFRKNKGDIWSYRKAADVCAKVQSGSTPKEGFFEKGIPFLKVYNIVNQKIDFDYRPQYIDEAIHTGSSAKSTAKPGDVVMNIVGPPLGKIAIVPETYKEWNINQAITLFRPSSEIISGWISIVLEGGDCLRSIMNETKGSAGQVNISLSQCRNFVFPVPSLAEQQEIVRRAERLFAFATQVEAKVAVAKTRVNNLTRSILAKAYRGELTRDWRAANPSSITGENSAEALLAKIKAQRKELENQIKVKSRGNASKNKTGNTMSKQIIKVTDALRRSGEPLSGQQLLAAAGYPKDSSTEQLEQFFLDIRKALTIDKTIVKLERSDDSQDWFTLPENLKK